ncbi:transposase [Kutzneria sp. NPDC052558]|uniref:transposase n=1 Tax=Kutzneria sp. NPDC052558 TaxID=3364121 RepID=UPI0037CC4245
MLSDEQWPLIEDLSPARTHRQGQPFADALSTMEVIVYRDRCGIAWRDVPSSGRGSRSGPGIAGSAGMWDVLLSRLGRGQSTNAAGSGTGRQGVFVAVDPGSSAHARDPRGDPGTGCSGRPPGSPGVSGRPAAGVRSGGLPGPQRDRAWFNVLPGGDRPARRDHVDHSSVMHAPDDRRRANDCHSPRPLLNSGRPSLIFTVQPPW